MQPLQEVGQPLSFSKLHQGQESTSSCLQNSDSWQGGLRVGSRKEGKSQNHLPQILITWGCART